MHVFKYFLLLILIPLMFSGCLLKKKSKGLSSDFGTDTALEQFPLDSFCEPSGANKLILQDIHFDYNQYNIKNSETQILSDIYNWLNEKQRVHLLIEGHCDERGSNEYNMALGEQRALNVRSYFIDRGIKPYRLQTISYGEEKPLMKGHNESAWIKNRRAHFLSTEEK
jgi:peptidoglycan-associated lipoprotein